MIDKKQQLIDFIQNLSRNGFTRLKQDKTTQPGRTKRHPKAHILLTLDNNNHLQGQKTYNKASFTHSSQ